MLIDEERPIKEISSALGFANEYYFSRFFRKHTGVPPGQYRTTHKSETWALPLQYPDLSGEYRKLLRR